MPLYQGNRRVKVHLDAYSLNMNIPDLIIGQFVLDFGSPIELVIDGEHSIQSVEETTIFGTAELVSNNTIIYTPSKVLTDYDVILGKTDTGVSAHIRIYPANNVLYEESFVTNVSGWTGEGTPYASVQDTPANDDVYGWDEHYYDDAAHKNKFFSNDTYLHGTVSKDNEPEANFTFTGTGVELLSECGQNTGVLYIRVTDAVKTDSGALKNKVFIVDTYFSGQFVNNNNNTVDVAMEYQVPVVQALNIPEGEHTVTVYGYYLENCGANLAKNSQVAVQVASAGATMSMGTDSGLNLDAILAEMGDEDAEVVYISMNEVLGGSDQGVAVYANQLADNADGAANSGLDVYFDGFRVYNPMSTEPEAYVEKNAEFIISKTLLQNSSYDEGTLVSTGCVMCSKLQSEDLEISTDVECLPRMLTESCYVCKISNECDVQLEVSTSTDSCTVFGLTGVDSLTSKTPMYYPARCIETASGRFFVLNNTSSSNGVCDFYAIKVLNGKFEYLSYTKEDIQEVLNIIYAERNKVLQSTDGYYLQDSEETYLQSADN